MARWALFLASLAWLGASDAGTAGPRTAITVWAAPFGGTSYAAAVPGATITEQRELDVGSGGDARAIGVAATIDPASVQLRDLTEPGATVRAQRFVPGATTPDEILARHVGDTIAVVTAKGELSGVLRAVDAQSLVLELGTGDQRHLQVLRREVVTDVRLPPGTTIDRPTLIWQLASKLPGRHTVELGYRADGMTWTADYLAVLDDKTLDFSAWATVRNATGASFGDAQLTLVTAAPHAAAASGPPRPVVPPQRFAIATPVRLGAGETVQVELVPPRTGAHPRRVVVFEPMPDPSGNFQAYPSTDCNQLSQSQPGAGRAETAIELDLPGGAILPEGRVRVFRRSAGRLDAVSEQVLRPAAGVARIELAPAADIVGTRKAVSCQSDDRTRTLREHVELELANTGKLPAEVVVREFMWRWPAWRLEDETPKGTRAAPQTEEYRLALPPGSKRQIAYSVAYQW